MITFIWGLTSFWAGVAVGVGGSWLATHPEQRSALWSRLRKRAAP